MRHSFLSSTVPFLSKNVDRKRCRKRLVWNHVRPAAPGGRNKDEYSGGARADIDLPRIVPRRRGGRGRPGGREVVTVIAISVYGYHNICMYYALRLDSIVMNT